jgi:hypothetical protein
MYDQFDALVRKNWRGTAIVSDSSIVVGVVTALSWLRPMPHPFRCFSDYEEGARWLESMFRPGELREDRPRTWRESQPPKRPAET